MKCPHLALLLAALLLTAGCAGPQASERSLAHHARRMFAGYGTWWSSDCLGMVSLEEVRKDTDIVVLKNFDDASPPLFAFHPPTNGRIVVFLEEPNRHDPTYVPPCEILFVDSDWTTCHLLHHGPECLNVLLQTDSTIRPFTWTGFHPSPPTLFRNVIQPTPFPPSF